MGVIQSAEADHDNDDDGSVDDPKYNDMVFQATCGTSLKEETSKPDLHEPVNGNQGAKDINHEDDLHFQSNHSDYRHIGDGQQEDHAFAG